MRIFAISAQADMLREPLHNPFSALASHHQMGYFV
jgi:hypothetical protein